MKMQSFGDKNFLDGGILLWKDPVCNTAFYLLRCDPFSDCDDRFRFGRLYVDISDSWIDRDTVMDFIGMTKETFSPEAFAVGCTDYYSWEEFGVDQNFFGFPWNDASEADIETTMALFTDDLPDDFEMHSLD